MLQCRFPTMKDECELGPLLFVSLTNAVNLVTTVPKKSLRVSLPRRRLVSSRCGSFSLSVNASLLPPSPIHRESFGLFHLLGVLATFFQQNGPDTHWKSPKTKTHKGRGRGHCYHNHKQIKATRGMFSQSFWKDVSWS